MDTTTPHGEFLFNTFGSLTRYERALIKERVMAGLAAARAGWTAPGGGRTTGIAVSTVPDQDHWGRPLRQSPRGYAGKLPALAAELAR